CPRWCCHKSRDSTSKSFGICRSDRNFFRRVSICYCYGGNCTENCGSKMAQTLFPRARPHLNLTAQKGQKVARYALPAAVSLFFFAITNAATLAGHQVPSGGTLDLQFPVNKFFQDYAAQGGNPRPTTGRLLMMFPKGFDPARSWPILIVTSTTDLGRTSPMDAPWYRDAAMAEGWVVLATDATIRPREDSLAWRLAMLTAGLQTLRESWPQSAQWPMAFAGYSGGAKRCGILGAMLAKENKVRICGFFLAGINSDRLSAAYNDYRPPGDFLNAPVWISSG